MCCCRLPRPPLQVLRQTADFVRGGGPQLEVLLRVKQAGSPAFAFLDPSDRLHPFYRCRPAAAARPALSPCAPPARSPHAVPWLLPLAVPAPLPSDRGCRAP